MGECLTVIGTEGILCNPIDIKRVISNLVINAAQASPPGANIHVRVLQKRGAATIEIEDHGSGIREDIRPLVFEPHFTTKEQGNGLGLPSCREIIERHHGGRLTFTPPSARARLVCELPGA